MNNIIPINSLIPNNPSEPTEEELRELLTKGRTAAMESKDKDIVYHTDYCSECKYWQYIEEYDRYTCKAPTGYCEYTGETIIELDNRESTLTEKELKALSQEEQIEYALGEVQNMLETAVFVAHNEGVFDDQEREEVLRGLNLLINCTRQHKLNSLKELTPKGISK